MATTLIPIAEERFAGYIAANYDGPYEVKQASSLDGYSLPMIMAKAGRFIELWPGSNVFQGSVSIAVMTQVDDDADPTATHDDAVNQITAALRDEAALTTFANAPGSHFHLYGAYIEAYDSDRAGDKESERAIRTIIDLTVNCQVVA